MAVYELEHPRTDAEPSCGDEEASRSRRAALALHTEERCSLRGHPPSASGECPCGSVRYD
jgi:hypothetical protein